MVKPVFALKTRSAIILDGMNMRKNNGGDRLVERYAEIAKALRDEIRSGVYSDNEPFPSLTQIMRRFGVSRPNAVRGVAELKRLGLVKTRRGSGTYASYKKLKIGLVIPGTADSEFFSAVMDELVALCASKNVDLVAGNVFPREHERRALQSEELARRLVAMRVSGVIMQPAEFTKSSERINRSVLDIFEKARIPVVLIDYDIVPPPERSNYDLVSINNFEAGRRLAAHLREVGVRKVVFQHYPLCSSCVHMRLAGVRSVFPKAHALVASPSDDKSVSAELKKFRPDAFVCGNDMAAAEIRKTLARLKVKVPGNVLLAGFDDVRCARETKPPLTTVHQPCSQLAEVAFTTLLERIKKPSLPACEMLLSAPLVVRESTQRVKKR